MYGLSELKMISTPINQSFDQSLISFNFLPILVHVNNDFLKNKHFQMNFTINMKNLQKMYRDWFHRILTHWGRVTHICVSKLTIIGSDNGLWPGRRQAIIWINAGILLIGPLRTNLSEIDIEILTFSFKKMDLKMSSGKWRPFCPGLNVLSHLL